MILLYISAGIHNFKLVDWGEQPADLDRLQIFVVNSGQLVHVKQDKIAAFKIFMGVTVQMVRRLLGYQLVQPV